MTLVRKTDILQANPAGRYGFRRIGLDILEGE